MFLAIFPLQSSECAPSSRAAFIEPRGQMFIPFIGVYKLAIRGGNVYNSSLDRLFKQERFHTGSSRIIGDVSIIDDCLKGCSKVHG
jgi:sulfatase maturation enzyme AslB (radical SAM superfamily)